MSMDIKSRFSNALDKEVKFSKIFVAGHKGMVGSAIIEKLKLLGFENIIIAEKSKLNLLNQSDVLDFFSDNKIDQVYIAAAKVGGILANSKYPADFIYENLMIQTNLIHAAYINGINRLLFLGSSCIYPRNTHQPMNESQLLTGQLETTNQAYAISKIAGIELCRSYNEQYLKDFRCVMPTNLYGKNDNFHPENSHVIPGLISKFHKAKRDNLNSIEIWGTGKSLREFLHVEDLAEACILIMNLSREVFHNSLSSQFPFINIGSGNEICIEDLVKMISRISKFSGDIIFDDSKPDGVQRKLLDISSISELGWKPKITLEEGIKDTYQWYSDNQIYLTYEK